jgi:outer membrane protein
VRLTERYFAVLGAGDNLDFAGAELRALRRQLEETRQRFEVGLIAITDVEEAQAGYSRARSPSYQRADPPVEPRARGYRGVGRPGTGAEPPPRRRSAAVDTAREEIDRQAAGHFPTLDLVGSHGFDTTGGRFGNVETDGTSIGLELAVPIFSGGAVFSRTREAAERHQQAIEQEEQARRETYRRTRVAFLGVMAGISRIKALKQAVQSSIVSVASTKAGLEVGTRTAVDVVVTEQALFRTRRDYARARYKYLLDTLRLKSAAGILTSGDLAAVSGFLQR